VYELGGAQVLSYRELVQLALRRRQRHRPLLPVPFAFWYAGAALLSVMKSPPLTRDQLVLMETDNVAHRGRPGFESLGLTPRGVGD
jgi:NADH dehydrogenase